MSAGEPVLREMTWQDIPALAALAPALFADDTWSEQTWGAELAGRPPGRHGAAEPGRSPRRHGGGGRPWQDRG